MAFLRPGKEFEKRLAAERMEDLLEMLKDIRGRLAEIHERIDTVERVLAERLPPDILTERTFREEVRSGDEIISEVISKVEELSKAKSIRDIVEQRLEEKLSTVETRRIEAITGLLHQHGKLSSLGLSRNIGLSRTRCNEYFKQMEEMGIVEPVLMGKQKFYRLR